MTHQLQWPKLKPSDTLSMAYQMLDEDSKRIFEAEKETDMAFDIHDMSTQGECCRGKTWLYRSS